jgi:hypothetical protein
MRLIRYREERYLIGSLSVCSGILLSVRTLLNGKTFFPSQGHPWHLGVDPGDRRIKEIITAALVLEESISIQEG